MNRELEQYIVHFNGPYKKENDCSCFQRERGEGYQVSRYPFRGESPSYIIALFTFHIYKCNWIPYLAK